MRAIWTILVLSVALGAAGCGGLTTQSVPEDDGTRAPFDDGPSWSPDGTKLAFYRGERDALFVIDVETRAERKLLGGAKWNDEYAWSPDGRSLAATSRRDGVESPRCYGLEPCPELYIVSAEGGSPHRLTENRTDEQALRWSPDGRYVAFFSTHDPSDARVWRDVTLVDVKSGAERRLTDDSKIENDMRWEADGRSLIVKVDDGTRFRLFRDGRRRELAAGSAPAFVGRAHSPGRSSDGTIADLSRKDKNGRTCWVDSGPAKCHPNSELYLRLRDGVRLRITHSRVDETSLTWSPDGRRLAFSSGGQLWLVDSDGSGLRQLTG